LPSRAGLDTLRGATRASDEAERRFLGALPDDEIARFRETLRAIAFSAPGELAPRRR